MELERKTERPEGAWDLGGRSIDVLLTEARTFKGRSLASDGWRRLRRDGASFLSLVFLSGLALLSLLAPILPLASPVHMDLQLEPRPPTPPWIQPAMGGFTPEYWELNPVDDLLVQARVKVFGNLQLGHWMGTDAKGRDLMARIVWGSRTSILVALAAALTSLVIGVTYGAVAGLAGGRVDNLMMRVVDVLYSLPFIFVVIFVLTLLGGTGGEEGPSAGANEVVLFAIIGAVWWLTMARVVRGQVLSLRRAAYVEAAQVMGASMGHVLRRHIVPNVASVVVVFLTLTLPAVMLFEAFLSFLGLGIQAPKVSWGLLAADGVDAINPLRVDWWIVFFPTLVMGATLLALNLLGDGLRDALDPRERSETA